MWFMHLKSLSHSYLHEGNFNICVFNGSGTDHTALTFTGDTVSFSSCCKTLQVYRKLPQGIVAVNCYSQWERKACGNESPWESQTWYKPVLHQKYIGLIDCSRRMPDFSECFIRAVEFGLDCIGDKMWRNCNAQMKPGQLLLVSPASVPRYLYFQVLWMVLSPYSEAVGLLLWSGTLWWGNWFGLQSFHDGYG